jgi:hypothetical protein
MKGNLLVVTIIIFLIIGCTTQDAEIITAPEPADTINSLLGKDINQYHIDIQDIEYLCTQGTCPRSPPEHIKEALEPCTFCDSAEIKDNILFIPTAERPSIESLAGCYRESKRETGQEMKIVENRYGIIRASGTEITKISQKGETCNPYTYEIHKHVTYTFSE